MRPFGDGGKFIAGDLVHQVRDDALSFKKPLKDFKEGSDKSFIFMYTHRHGPAALKFWG